MRQINGPEKNKADEKFSITGDVEQNRLSQEHRFSQTVLIHRELILRSAMQMTGSISDAEDIVQDTLLKAYHAFDRLRPQSQMRPWLLRILRNTFISQWRRRRRERTILQQNTGDESVWWLKLQLHAEPEPRRPGDDLGDEVVEALEEVPTHYRTCVILVDLHQKSYQEAAQLTKQPLGTVQSRLFRGRRILKGLLQEYAQKEGYLSQAA